jgi:hypothetical protein
MPAFATRSSVSSARASSCAESEQQWPTTTRPSKPVSILSSAMSRRVSTLASIVSSTWKSASSPRAAAWAKKPLHPVAQVGHGVGHHAQNAALGLGHEIGGVAEVAVSSVHLSQPIRHTACKVDPVGPVRLKLPEDGPGDVVLRRDAVEMRADRAGAVGIGRAQRERHARAQVLGAPAAALSARTVVSAPMKLPSGLGLRGQICPCRDGCACRRRPGKTMAPPMSTAIAEAIRDHGRRRWRCRCGSGRPPAPKGRRGR